MLPVNILTQILQEGGFVKNGWIEKFINKKDLNQKKTYLEKL